MASTFSSACGGCRAVARPSAHDDAQPAVSGLIAVANSAETAGWAAAWAEGLATALQPPHALEKVLAAYESAGGTGPRILQVHVSWAPTDAEALAIAKDQWSHAVLSPPTIWDLEQPEDFDAAAGEPSDQQLRDALLISSDLDELAQRIADHARLGFDRIYLHNVGRNQREWIEVFGGTVVPALTR